MKKATTTKTSIEFIQCIKEDFNSFKVGFEFSNEDKKQLSKIVGTSCYELFQLIDLQKAGVSKLFKLSAPIDIVVKGRGFKLDTTQVDKQLRSKLKLNSTPQSKTRFAKRVFELASYISRTQKVLTIEDIEQLFAE